VDKDPYWEQLRFVDERLRAAGFEVVYPNPLTRVVRTPEHLRTPAEVPYIKGVWCDAMKRAEWSDFTIWVPVLDPAELALARAYLKGGNDDGA